MNPYFAMNPNDDEEERQPNAFDVNDESDVYFLQQAYEYHETLLADENRPVLTRENNDINILDNFTLFDDHLDNKALVAPFVVNGVGYEKGYVVPTGRVIVPIGRYVVPTGRVIVPTGSLKRTGRDRDEGVIIFPPTTTEEHIVVQRESKARTNLLQSIPDDHVPNFHYIDDARDIWNAVKAR
nr:xylulose kinase-1 [Tanacetum cinerariifolium]